MTSTSEISYVDKIGLMLLSLEKEKSFILAEKVAPENKDKFMNIVKSYIDKNFGWNEKWEIIFSNDYSMLKKIERV